MRFARMTNVLENRDATQRRWTAARDIEGRSTTPQRPSRAYDAAMNRRPQWNDLSPQQQRGIVVGGIVELVLTAFVLADLAKRPADAVRGSKIAWALACVVQPFGPLAYLLLGRRPRS
jgi:hypothetical protein